MKLQPIALAGAPASIAATAAPAPPAADAFEVVENDDGTVTFPLLTPDGGTFEVTMRDPLTSDMLAMEQFILKSETATDSAAVIKMCSLMCIKWGDQPGISYDDLTNIPFRKNKQNLRRIAQVLKEFFRLEDLLSPT